MDQSPPANLPSGDFGHKAATTSPQRGANVDPLSMMKSLQRKDNADNGESGSSNGGNNSDNSALVSIGNTSFGFNFDSEEGMSNSTNTNSEHNDNSEDSDGPTALGHSTKVANRVTEPQHQYLHTVSSITASSSSNNHRHREVLSSLYPLNAAAADHVASLQELAKNMSNETKKRPSRKRKVVAASGRSDNESGGYNTDDEGNGQNSGVAASSEDPTKATGCSGPSDGRTADGHGKKLKHLDERKREERNQREKERSFRISKQINELRSLLSTGGIIVPKGTKNAVLTEAANYIKLLQQYQYRSEIDRQQLVQQMQLIGSGNQGAQAAAAIRHVAAKNGVWSLGNFGGVPPKSAMTSPRQAGSTIGPAPQETKSQEAQYPTKVVSPDYRFIFNSCGVAMAVASLGGAFIDCNHLFCMLASYNKQEICSLTIFNLTAREDLQHAFDRISQLISPLSDRDNADTIQKPVLLRGAVKNRSDLGVSISLVKGEDGIAKCFCVTLVKNPVSSNDTVALPVSFDALPHRRPSPTASSDKDADDEMNSSTPAFTSG